MNDHSNDVTSSPQGAATSEMRNLPYDKHGCVDWAKLREIQLQGYSTAELEAELARRTAKAPDA